MQIKKILNNNAVITKNSLSREIIAMGKGIGYGKEVGDFIDESKIFKIFELSENNERNKIIELIKEIPLNELEIAKKGCDYTKNKYHLEVNDSLYMALADHIYTSVARYRENIYLTNNLLYEIKKFYKNEYEIGKYILSLINDEYQIVMKDDEAAFLALHIVGCEVSDSANSTYLITNFIHSMLDIVESYFKCELDSDSLSYARFITHLKFFSLRVFESHNNKASICEKSDILEIIKEKYVDAYICASKMAGYIQRYHKYNLSDEELLYLTIHVAKVVNKN